MPQTDEFRFYELCWHSQVELKMCHSDSIWVKEKRISDHSDLPSPCIRIGYIVHVHDICEMHRGGCGLRRWFKTQSIEAKNENIKNDVISSVLRCPVMSLVWCGRGIKPRLPATKVGFLMLNYLCHLPNDVSSDRSLQCGLPSQTSNADKHLPSQECCPGRQFSAVSSNKTDLILYLKADISHFPSINVINSFQWLLWASSCYIHRTTDEDWFKGLVCLVCLLYHILVQLCLSSSIGKLLFKVIYFHFYMLLRLQLSIRFKQKPVISMLVQEGGIRHRVVNWKIIKFQALFLYTLLLYKLVKEDPANWRRLKLSAQTGFNVKMYINLMLKVLLFDQCVITVNRYGIVF